MVIIDNKTDLSNIDFKEGAVILIDKPYEWTSFDVVNKIRYRLRHLYQQKKFKVGHNGTLDPLATGLLMIFTGKYTKKIPLEENHDKKYTAKIKFGFETESLDRETEEINPIDIDQIDLSSIKKTCDGFIGEQIQEIPIYSATKTKGVAMYKLARNGIEFERKSKKVIFHSIDNISYNPPFCTCDILCGKGTYIRAFARDLAEKLNNRAYLYDLKRTQIGDYKVDGALNIEEICQKLERLEHKS